MEGSALLYQCNPGFGPVGEMTAVCAANGSWSPDPADVTCREIGICNSEECVEHLTTLRPLCISHVDMPA